MRARAFPEPSSAEAEATPPAAPDAAREALRLCAMAVYLWRPDLDRLTWSDPEQAARVLGGAGPADLASNAGFDARIGEAGARERRRLCAAARAGDGLRVEYMVHGPDGETIWIEERAAPSPAPSGSPATVVGAVRVVTDQKRRERALAEGSQTDDLTGLWTRQRMRAAVETAVARAGRLGEPAGYLAIGVDDLAAVNARFGFDAADQGLAEVARRLAEVARTLDVVARTGGNKFAVLLANCPPDAIEGAARRYLSAVRGAPVSTAAGPIDLSVSIGAAGVTRGDLTSEAVMSLAEAALEAAKAQGPGSFAQLAEDARPTAARARQAELSKDILGALAEDRIRLAFQPIVDAETGATERFECLARMLGPGGAVVPAADFIAAAESAGFVRRIDVRVLALAGARLGADPRLALAVNVSGGTVRDPDAAAEYLAGLVALRGRARRLTVELTETCVVEDRLRAAAFAAEVRRCGARFAIDDFGAGYTSFGQLEALEPDEVKIDGGFVRDLSANPSQQIFVRALVDLARSLHLEVVAEWVGSPEDAALLRRLGATLLQGRLYGMPSFELGRDRDAKVA